MPQQFLVCALKLDSERLHQVHLERDWVASNFHELKFLVLDSKRQILRRAQARPLCHYCLEQPERISNTGPSLDFREEKLKLTETSVGRLAQILFLNLVSRHLMLNA